MWAMGDISQDLVQARLEQVLPRYIGPGRPMSYALAAEKLQVHRRSVENWCYGAEVPSLSNFLKLGLMLGPAFVNELLRPIGLSAESAAAGKVSDHQLQADLALSTAQVAQCLIDGRVDHTERAGLRPQLLELQERITHYLAEGKT